MNFYQGVLDQLGDKKAKLQQAIEDGKLMILEAKDRIDEANADERMEKARHEAKLENLRRKYEDDIADEKAKHNENQRRINLFRAQAESEIDNRESAIPSYEHEIKQVDELIKATEERQND